MALETPPSFQEASRCDVCHCSFTAFRRRHHCRCCGRTLCNEHSSYHMALPQYGIHTDVRVCYECSNKSSSSGGQVKNKASPVSSAVATDAFTRLNVDKDDDTTLPMASSGDQSAVVTECKCGMPLCICEATKPEPAPAKILSNAISTAQPNPRPRKPSSNQLSDDSSAKKPAASSNSSSFLNLGQVSNGSMDKSLDDYEVNGEGLREAIKSGDAQAVRKLLSQGVDSNYCDKQGFSLLHLAALFNQTEIALILMDSGANLQRKNAQGETPLDCAPTMLQYKMRKRMEELAAAGPSSNDIVN